PRSSAILRSIASNEIERPSSTLSVVVVVVVACVVVVVVVGCVVVVVVVGAAVDVVVVVGGVSPPCTPGTSSGCEPSKSATAPDCDSGSFTTLPFASVLGTLVSWLYEPLSSICLSPAYLPASSSFLIRLKSSSELACAEVC